MPWTLKISKDGYLELGALFFVATFPKSIITIHRKSFKSSENKEVVIRLVKEVKGLNPSFDAADIRGTMTML